jgi:hypothetical protein
MDELWDRTKFTNCEDGQGNLFKSESSEIVLVLTVMVQSGSACT